MNQVSIGSDNVLSPIRRQAYIFTGAGLFSTGPFRRKFSEILIKIKNIHENASKIIVCEIANILCRREMS